MSGENLQPAVGQVAWRDRIEAVTDSLDDLQDTADLQMQRVAFGHFSQQLQSLLEDSSELQPEDLFVASCPMWHDSPAQWIQRDKIIRNPFMGQTMSSCGVVEHPFDEATPKGGLQ